eukprot:scaffold1220_cov259-Pinguiococcus_pyrenoidosus.AAC.8
MDSNRARSRTCTNRHLKESHQMTQVPCKGAAVHSRPSRLAHDLHRPAQRSDSASLRANRQVMGSTYQAPFPLATKEGRSQPYREAVGLRVRSARGDREGMEREWRLSDAALSRCEGQAHRRSLPDVEHIGEGSRLDKLQAHARSIGFDSP